MKFLNAKRKAMVNIIKYPYPFIKNNKLLTNKQVYAILKYLGSNIDFDIAYPEEIIFQNRYLCWPNTFRWFLYEVFKITSEFFINKNLSIAKKEYKNVKHLQCERVSYVYRYYYAILSLLNDAMLVHKERIFLLHRNIIDDVLKEVQNITGRHYSYSELLGYFKTVIKYFIKNINWLYQQELHERENQK